MTDVVLKWTSQLSLKWPEKYHFSHIMQTTDAIIMLYFQKRSRYCYIHLERKLWCHDYGARRSRLFGMLNEAVRIREKLRISSLSIIIACPKREPRQKLDFSLLLWNFDVLPNSDRLKFQPIITVHLDIAISVFLMVIVNINQTRWLGRNLFRTKFSDQRSQFYNPRI